MKGFINSFKYAMRGILLASRGRNFRIQLLLFLSNILFGLYFRINETHWLSILSFGALVLGAEAINTAIEELCDLYSTDYNPKIERIKDLSAGAVLIICIFALISGIRIFSNYFF